MATVGERTRRKLSTVHPTLRDIVTEALEQAPPWLDFAVTWGQRSTRQQQDLWFQGRDADGNIVDERKVVTYCDGIIKKSNHQAHDDGQAYAIDIVAYENGKIVWDERETTARAAYIIGYAAARGIVITGGVKWDWDLGHLELKL